MTSGLIVVASGAALCGLDVRLTPSEVVMVMGSFVSGGLSKGSRLADGRWTCKRSYILRSFSKFETIWRLIKEDDMIDSNNSPDNEPRPGDEDYSVGDPQIDAYFTELRRAVVGDAGKRGLTAIRELLRELDVASPEEREHLLSDIPGALQRAREIASPDTPPPPDAAGAATPPETGAER
jgi:hypothetical protein